MLPPRLRSLLLALVFVVCGIDRLAAGDFAAAPVPLQSALFMKILGFNRSLGKDVKVFVLGDEAFAAELRKQVGAPIGSTSMLSQVEAGSALPAEKPDILYIGAGQASVALRYTAEQKVLSITGNVEAQAAGVTLAVLVGRGDSKPKVLLNPASAKAESVEWNPAIMKVATVAP